MYYEYWDLKKSPFDNVPDPTMYADCHTTMENAIAESLFAIEEGEDCIAVIVGNVGLGKTMSIRMIIDSLDHENHKIALVTNPSTTFVQILREIVGQLTGKPCEEKRKVDLLEIFNNLLFKTADEGKKILIFIDEANAISASNLESLRLLTNMQTDQRNLFTIVLVGQMELAKRLEHPKRANLFQRVGTYCKIEKIQSEVLTRSYVETRLKLAGTTTKIFTDDAFHSLWEYSEHGVPRLINKICKLSLKAGETNELSEINGEVICQIGERFKKMSSPAKQMRAPRKRPKSEMLPVTAKETEFVMEEEKTQDLLTQIKVNLSKTDDISEDLVEETTGPITENSILLEQQTTLGNYVSAPEKEGTELEIGNCKIKLNLPSHLVQEARFSSNEHCKELAGVMAVQTIKENPQLMQSPTDDPVPVWDEIKNYIFGAIKSNKIIA